MRYESYHLYVLASPISSICHKPQFGCSGLTLSFNVLSLLNHSSLTGDLMQLGMQGTDPEDTARTAQKDIMVTTAKFHYKFIKRP